MRFNIVKGLAVLALAALVVLLSGRGAVAAPGESSAPLVGTWRVSVAQVDCSTGAPLSPTPFSSLVTFNLGGTVAEDTTNPAFGVGQRSAGQGVWSHTGHHTYSARSVAYIQYTTPPNPAAHNPGFNAGEQTITQAITYNNDADTWTSTAAIGFIDGTDPATAPYRAGCAVASATRF